MSSNTAAVSNSSNVMVVALGACHMEATGSHMTQAAVLSTAMVALCATNIFAPSTCINLVVPNIDLGQVKGPMKGPMKGPVKKDQVVFWNDCNQIGSGNVR